MAKLLVNFDSYYSLDSYDAKQALGQFRALPGVNAMKVYRAVEGKPQYTVEVETGDDAVDSLKQRVQGAFTSYSGYVSNLDIRVLKEIAV